jgi:hypothetical protein
MVDTFTKSKYVGTYIAIGMMQTNARHINHFIGENKNLA